MDWSTFQRVYLYNFQLNFFEVTEVEKSGYDESWRPAVSENVVVFYAIIF